MTSNFLSTIQVLYQSLQHRWNLCTFVILSYIIGVEGPNAFVNFHLLPNIMWLLKYPGGRAEKVDCVSFLRRMQFKDPRGFDLLYFSLHWPKFSCTVSKYSVLDMLSRRMSNKFLMLPLKLCSNHRRRRRRRERLKRLVLYCDKHIRWIDMTTNLSFTLLPAPSYRFSIFFASGREPRVPLHAPSIKARDLYGVWVDQICALCFLISKVLPQHF